MKQLLACISTCIIAITANAAATTASLALVPMPREVVPQEGAAALGAEWVVTAPSGSDEDLHAARLIADEAKARFGWDWRVSSEASSGTAVVIRAGEARPADPALLRTQGYRLNIRPEGVEVVSESAAGRYYGAQTLRQLIRTAEGASLPAMEITDWPALEWRGISDDISRGQVSNLDDFRGIIRDLAFHKKNLYMPYIEDMYAFETDPNIGRTRGAVTPQEMAAMVEEGRRNHVIVTPAFETLGHQDRLLGLPHNRRFAELRDQPEATPWSFSPALPEARAFVKRLVDELAEATPAPFFHIGGDESYDVGKGLSAGMVKRDGIGIVHARYFKEIHDHLKRRFGRPAMLYSDMILGRPEALEEMPKDAIIVDWHYDPQSTYPSVMKLRDAGLKRVVVSPGIWSWSTFYPHYWKGFPNTVKFAAVGKRDGAIGSITSSWGDNGAENLRENNRTGYALSAAAEWEAGSPETDEFLARFAAENYGPDARALAEVEKLLGWQEFPGGQYYGSLFHKSLKLRPAKDEWIARMAKLGGEMKRARQLIAENRAKVRYNAAHLDSLDHAARRFAYVADRELTLDRIARMLDGKSTGELSAPESSAIGADLARLRDELLAITAEFAQLWLRNNKYPMLDFNLERLGKQTAALQDMLDRQQAGTLAQAPPVTGTWIWFDEPLPHTSASTGMKWFVRDFTPGKDPVLAELKVWVDDRATVFVNGQKVMSVVHRDPAQSASILHLLKPGRNTIAIEAENRWGAGGMIANLELRYADGTSELLTGDTIWRSTKKQPRGAWKSGTGTGAWNPARILGEGAIDPWTGVDW